MAPMLDILLRPRMAGRFAPESSATLAEYVSSLDMAGFPAGSPFTLRAILQRKDSSQTTAPCPAPDMQSLFVKFSSLMSCPRERDARSNVCAYFRPTMLMLLPVSSRIVSIPSTMVPLFAAKANSW
eukprot:9063744-Pyramimonas_sp.AAC.1